MSIEAMIKEVEAQAGQSGDVRCWWNTASLILTVWSSCKDGWFPSIKFDPRYNKALQGLAKAYRRFGDELLNAANARAFHSAERRG